jgi:hypothetical protein
VQEQAVVVVHPITLEVLRLLEAVEVLLMVVERQGLQILAEVAEAFGLEVQVRAAQE